MRELNDDINEFESLPALLEEAALMLSDIGDKQNEHRNFVSIMTIHAAKGLEFDTVFLPAWEEGIFPNEKKSDADIEEERRLAYVAITRAKTRAIITNAMGRTLFGQWSYQSPSRFINEIDRRYVSFNGAEQPRQHIDTHKQKPRVKIESVVGKMVIHAEMGTGVVIADNDQTLTVAFKTRGIKNVARDFVKFI